MDFYLKNCKNKTCIVGYIGWVVMAHTKVALLLLLCYQIVVLCCGIMVLLGAVWWQYGVVWGSVVEIWCCVMQCGDIVVLGVGIV